MLFCSGVAQYKVGEASVDGGADGGPVDGAVVGVAPRTLATLCEFATGWNQAVWREAEGANVELLFKKVWCAAQ